MYLGWGLALTGLLLVVGCTDKSDNNSSAELKTFSEQQVAAMVSNNKATVLQSMDEDDFETPQESLDRFMRLMERTCGALDGGFEETEAEMQEVAGVGFDKSAEDTMKAEISYRLASERDCIVTLETRREGDSMTVTGFEMKL
jgi:hypothetical protein